MTNESIKQHVLRLKIRDVEIDTNEIRSIGYPDDFPPEFLKKCFILTEASGKIYYTFKGFAQGSLDYSLADFMRELVSIREHFTGLPWMYGFGSRTLDHQVEKWIKARLDDDTIVEVQLTGEKAVVKLDVAEKKE